MCSAYVHVSPRASAIFKWQFARALLEVRVALVLGDPAVLSQEDAHFAEGLRCLHVHAVDVTQRYTCFVIAHEEDARPIELRPYARVGEAHRGDGASALFDGPNRLRVD